VANNTTSADQFKLDAGEFNPVLGKSYGEIAAESRSQHKSQGFGVPRGRGEAIEYFRTLGGDAPMADLYDGVNTTWSKVVNGSALNEIQSLMNELTKSFDFAAPQGSVPQLIKIYTALNRLPETTGWVVQKKKEVKELIAAASGLWMEAYTNTAAVAQGDSLQISVVLNNRLGQNVRLKSIQGGLLKAEISLAPDTVLPRNRNIVFQQKIIVSAAVPVTQPYWLKEKMAEGFFNVSEQLLIGQPDVQPAATIDLIVSINGVEIPYTNLPVRYKFNDQVRGELYEPFVVLPPFTVETSKSTAVLRTEKPWMQEFTYTAQRPLDTLRIYSDNGAIVSAGRLQKGERRTYRGAFEKAPSSKKAVASLNFSQPYYVLPQSQPAKTLHTIRYEHIPHINYFTDAENRFVRLDVKTEGKKIGYITGAGDKVPEALTQMGYDVTLLTEKGLEQANLQQFDAIMPAYVPLMPTIGWDATMINL
jgi:hypothetical protein